MKISFLKNGIIILIILVLGFLYHYNYLNKFPSHIHAWAQADRYAIALGYVDNGLNFFKPQTFVYNHQFPDNWQGASPQTITAVDFPIHDYIPALFMKMTGNTSAWIFRTYILLYSFLGLFFLFKLSYALTLDYGKSVFVMLFAATSPVFVYYQAGFLPSIPSLSNAILGIYFYHLHLQRQKINHFWLSMFFLSLATLARTTLAIPLIAVLSIELVRLLKRETQVAAKIIPICLAVIAPVAYLLYNAYLRNKYGSIFLNQVLPAGSVDEAWGIIKIVYNSWGFQYFTRSHYAVCGAVIVTAAGFLIARKQLLDKNTKYFGMLTIIYLIGCVLFALLMLKQFPSHDYYFLDTFYIPTLMVLTLTLALIPLPEKRIVKVISIAIICVVGLVLALKPIYTQEKRRDSGSWDKSEAMIRNFENSAVFLDSAGISRSAKILVLDAVAPNIPFIHLRRKGFAVMSIDKESIEQALKWDYDYIVIQNEFFISQIYSPYPEFLSRLNKIADNGKISVCTLTKNNPQSIFDFAGLSKKTPVFQQLVTFETKPDSLWVKADPTDSIVCNGKAAGHLKPEEAHGIAYKTKHIPVLEDRSRTLFFNSNFRKQDEGYCAIIISISVKGEYIYYKSYNLEELMKQKETWEKISLVLQLPKIEDKDYEFSIYLSNSGQSDLYYDDFGFSIY